MRNAAGEPAYGFHLLRLAQLLFQVLLFRDVAHHAQVTAGQDIGAEAAIRPTFAAVTAMHPELPSTGAGCLKSLPLLFEV